MNDFHGNLEASKFTHPGPDGKPVAVQAGGIGALAAAVTAWRAQDPELVLVGAGDLVGGTPAMSSMWNDEPTINALNLLGMNFSSVGNHEFDSGRIELMRKQKGGCETPRADKACKLAPDFSGAKFQYLAANVIDKATGKPFLPAWRIEEVRGVKIGFIGAVLQGTPELVLASGIAGLAFEDEATAINRVMPELRAAGATVFVVLIHEGGSTKEPYHKQDCTTLTGPIVDISKKLDPAVRLVVSGHTHTGFQCKVEGRTITQAEYAGHMLTRIKLTIDPATRALQGVQTNNVVVKPGDFPQVQAVADYLDTVRQRSQAALAKPVGRSAVRSVERRLNPAGESPLGGIVADAVLAATKDHGADIGLINTAGVRKDLESGADGVVTYGQAQAVLPFANTLLVMELTGRQLVEMLEMQWMRENVDARHSMLQVSRNVTYQWDSERPRGSRVVPGSVLVNGQPVDPDKVYRVAANNFLAEGGDGFPIFIKVPKHATQIVDIDAFIDYLAKGGLAQPAAFAAPAPRIVRVK
ncbi:bifunctional metallophosphatase/5'-nucleotidase [Pseudoduganella sp. GCM10020061]|uniref:bifunctional metallophosphatase/5'-nucleotidase n=1 Tax=Pseudoduganella sp. GCM10020061 TaxID=3317345 RepID=UPI003639A967